MKNKLFSAGDDVNFALILAESNSSVAESEQGVVAAAANVDAGTETGAALTDDDGTGADSFAAKSLNTEKLGIAVAAVAAAGLTFLMSHDNTSKFYVNCFLLHITFYKISPKWNKIKSTTKKNRFFLKKGWKIPLFAVILYKLLFKVTPFVPGWRNRQTQQT